MNASSGSEHRARCATPRCSHRVDRHSDKGSCLVESCPCVAYSERIDERTVARQVDPKMSVSERPASDFPTYQDFQDALMEETDQPEWIEQAGRDMAENIRRHEGKVVQKWADQAMFTAEPIDADAGPRVYLLWMTPDPLAAIAAPSKMYKGEVARSLRDVSHAERQEYIEQIKKTKLQAPFEFVKFHFMIEGVTRAFTHQMVRQRTAVYAQESLRFAVKEDMPVGLPPSLAGTTGELSAWHTQEDYDRASEAERDRYMWDQGIAKVKATYDALIANGMPAEDARGLLPHNTLTRLHYSTDLRALLDHAGNRLCTQAQFEWRLVFSRIAEAIRNYSPYEGLLDQMNNLGEIHGYEAIQHCAEADRWQYEAVASLFAPVCYQTGKCEFNANFDRPCNIRNRVRANHELARPSRHWGEEYDAVQGNPLVSGVGPQSVVRDEDNRPVFIGAIKPAEWLLRPDAAR